MSENKHDILELIINRQSILNRNNLIKYIDEIERQISQSNDKSSNSGENYNNAKHSMVHEIRTN